LSDTSGACAVGFTVVIPVLDEQHAILATIDALESALTNTAMPWELLVVDDGSRDATPGLLSARRGIRVVTHATNRGYGAALKSGIRAAKHPLVVVIDADATYPAADVPRLVELCAGVDMVVGARTGRNVQSTPLRSFVKWFFRQYAQWLTGARIPDLNSGLRVFRHELADRFADILPDGFSFTTTITVGSLLDGLRVRFEPIDYMTRIGHSKLHPVLDTMRIARQLVRLGIRARRRRFLDAELSARS
jgi:glycosyltransferase involved in cell wall biosynthesis